jgi:hypothetical protein
MTNGPTVLRLTQAQAGAIEIEQPEDHQLGDYGDPDLDAGMVLLGAGVDYARCTLTLPTSPTEREQVAAALNHLSNVNDDVAEGLTSIDDAAMQRGARGAARALLNVLLRVR